MPLKDVFQALAYTVLDPTVELIDLIQDIINLKPSNSYMRHYTTTAFDLAYFGNASHYFISFSSVFQA
jgi:hypothetical protein